MNYEIIGKRNPQIIFKAEDTTKFIIQTIGDPHLGRNYRNNLRSRLGDREEMMKENFISLLNNKANLVVIMGDLFDKVVVTNEWLDFTIQSLKEALDKNKYTTYVILNGNHDEVKDKSRISSFRLLEKYFDNINQDLLFISDNIYNMELLSFNVQLCFTNYNSFKTLEEYVSKEDLNLKEDYLKIAFGHFEVESFGSDKFIDREIPKILLDNFDLIVTGHIHKPSFLTIENTSVLVTGSMQPYAFGEEIEEDGTLYTVVSNTSLKELLEANPDVFINSNVKVLYEKDDDLVSPFNCLSLSFKLLQSQVGLEKELEIPTQTLSFTQMFLQSLKERTNEENISFSQELEHVFLEKSY